MSSLSHGPAHAADVPAGSLCTDLQLAVPLWLAVVRDCSPTELAAVIGESAQVLGANGALQHLTGEPAAAARVINHLARLIAVAALGRGGVTFAGLHWCDPGRDQPLEAG
jgi:hypothetical protein